MNKRVDEVRCKKCDDIVVLDESFTWVHWVLLNYDHEVIDIYYSEEEIP